MTIAILPLLLAKAVTCKHKEFVEFISVSVYWLCSFTLHKCVTVSTWTWRSTISIAVKFRDKPNLWSEISYSGRGQFLLTFHSSHLMKIVPCKIFAQSFNWIQCRLQKWGCKQSSRKHSVSCSYYSSPDVLVFLLLFLSLLLMSWRVLHVFFLPNSCSEDAAWTSNVSSPRKYPQSQVSIFT